ncbi:MAG: PaaI family thioesterase [Alphaproteobacteria bacterium]
MPVMDAKMLADFIDEHFPQIAYLKLNIDSVDDKALRLRLPMSKRHLRPGGTVSGPALMALTDTAMYLMLLSRIGPATLAVTTNLNINFLRKPGLADVIAEARMLKLGKRLAVGEVTLYSDGEAEPVAHATMTYSIPSGHQPPKS